MRYYDTARGNDTLLEFNLLYDSQLFRFGILFLWKDQDISIDNS